MIAVALFTCDRPAERRGYAKRTLENLAYKIVAPEPLHLHIADDGSSQDFRDELAAIASNYFGDRVTVTNSGGRGYGASYNAMTSVVHDLADLVLPLEDDWELVRGLDLGPIMKVLRAGVFNCVRMAYIGYTGELRCQFVWAERMHWLALDSRSSEHHVFSAGPRLETVEFERRLGLWPEDLCTGGTEMAVCARAAARVGVAWPVSLINPTGDAFAHIGTKQSMAAKRVLEAVK